MSVDIEKVRCCGNCRFGADTEIKAEKFYFGRSIDVVTVFQCQEEEQAGQHIEGQAFVFVPYDSYCSEYEQSAKSVEEHGVLPLRLTTLEQTQQGAPEQRILQ